MTLAVSRLQQPTKETNYLSAGFRNNIENHLDYLRESGKSTLVTIEPFKLVKYKGDFYGLLNSLQKNQDVHWIIMRLNGMYNPIEFDERMTEILIPDDSELRLLLGRYLNTNTTL